MCDNKSVADDWCVTRMKETNFSFMWKIDDFLLRAEKNGEFLKSSIFPAEPSKHKWRLQVYPKGENSNYTNNVYYYICLVSSTDTKVFAKFETFFLNTDHEKCILQKKEGNVNNNERFQLYNTTLETLNKEKLILPNKSLTIMCEIKTFDYNFNISGQNKSCQYEYSKLYQNKDSKRNLMIDLTKLLENKDLCDVTLEVEGQELQAHKIILSARSDVFAAMFKNNMIEQKTNRVIVKDVNYNTMKEIIEFIYTANASNLEENCVELLKAADKYALIDLKEICEEYICNNKVSSESAADFLILADAYNVKRLKSLAMSVIYTKAADAIKSQSWQTLLPEHGHLLAELFETYFLKYETEN